MKKMAVEARHPIFEVILLLDANRLVEWFEDSDQWEETCDSNKCPAR